MSDSRTGERPARSANGYTMALAGIVLIVLLPLLAGAGVARTPGLILTLALCSVVGVLLLVGLTGAQHRHAARLSGGSE